MKLLSSECWRNPGPEMEKYLSVQFTVVSMRDAQERQRRFLAIKLWDCTEGDPETLLKTARDCLGLCNSGGDKPQGTVPKTAGATAWHIGCLDPDGASEGGCSCPGCSCRECLLPVFGAGMLVASLVGAVLWLKHWVSKEKGFRRRWADCRPSGCTNRRPTGSSQRLWRGECLSSTKQRMNN